MKFLSRGSGYTLFLTGEEVVLTLQTSRAKPRAKKRGAGTKNEIPLLSPPTVLRLKLAGGNPASLVSGLEQLPAKSNYFIGNDPRKWRTDIPTFAKIKYHDVYRGVDLVYYGNQHQLEYDFVVAPGADPKPITWVVGGTRAPLRIDSRGNLVLRTESGEVRFYEPVVYQPATDDEGGRHPLSGRFVLKGSHEFGFQLADYDTSQPLVIDPVLSYSTYLGGDSLDSGNGIAVDSGGSAYVTGETASTNFPTTADAYQADNAGGSDVFVTKLDSTGTLVYSTYLGGQGLDRGNGIAVDASGNAYVTGRTNSEDFPTMNPWQSQILGDFDAFVTVLSAQGDALLYSTYLGGSGNDEGSAIAVDQSGNAYVTGGVGIGSQDDFPTTSGAFQRVFGGDLNDAFVTKFDPTRSGSASLVYSTFLGGSGVERGNSIAVDSAGNAYITGRTASTDFPTQNPLQAAHGDDHGSFDAFVSVLDCMGSSLIYSTYLGGSRLDQGYGIAVDSAGNAYVTGQTFSTDFLTVNALQTSNGGDSDAFVVKIDSTGSSLVYSTYLGGNGADLGSGIAVDTSGVAYVTGRTSSSTDFPTSADAIQPAFGGGPNDAFVAKIDPSLSDTASLLYSSYLGGSDLENLPATGSGGNPSGAIALDASGSAYVTGNTSSTDFPTSVNPYQASNGGGIDAFVTKIAFCSTPSFPSRPVARQRVRSQRLPSVASQKGSR